MNENLQINSHEEDYFKFCIWYPYLTSKITHLKERFSKQSRSTLSLFKLLNSVSIDSNVFKEVYTLYKITLNCTEDELLQELKLYMILRKSNTDSLNLLQQLEHLPPLFINLKIILQIAVTLPITTCSAERSFSAMKILKSSTRSTMTDETLIFLALMYIHKDIAIEEEEIVTDFSNSGHHNLAI